MTINLFLKFLFYQLFQNHLILIYLLDVCNYQIMFIFSKVNIYILYTIYIYIYIYTRKAGDLGSTPSDCQIFYLFRCVLSSMLPLRSVGRSNFDKGRHNLTTLIQETDIY